MKLKDVESKELLPSWADNAEWMQNGLDLAVRSISTHIPGMGAPFTLDAVKSLSDEELEALYDQIGIVKYYPDLSRSTRESFIFEISTNARYLGTPAVVEKLIKYIFDGQPVNVTIHDNLAFDSSGTLVDSSLLDTYDIELNIPVSNLPELVLSRLYENLYNLVRNTQKLRAVDFTFDDEIIDCNIYFGIIPAETPGIVVDIENDAVCDMPPAPPIIEEDFVPNNTGEIANVTLSSYQSKMIYDRSGNSFNFEAGWFISEVFYLSGSNLVSMSDYFVNKTKITVYNTIYLAIQNVAGASNFYALLVCKKYNTKKAYFGRSTTSDYSINYHTNTALYDENGNRIPYDNSKRYTFSAVQYANSRYAGSYTIRMISVDGNLGYYSDASGSACALYYIEDVPTFTAYLNADKSESTLSPLNTYNWMLYSSKSVKKSGDGSSTFELTPAIQGMYLQAQNGNLYLKGSPTTALTISSVTYIEA